MAKVITSSDKPQLLWGASYMRNEGGNVRRIGNWLTKPNSYMTPYVKIKMKTDNGETNEITLKE